MSPKRGRLPIASDGRAERFLEPFFGWIEADRIINGEDARYWLSGRENHRIRRLAQGCGARFFDKPLALISRLIARRREEIWQKLAEAWEVNELSDQARSSITDAVNTYFWWLPFEENAPTRTKARNVLYQMRRGSSYDPDTDEGYYVRDLVKKHGLAKAEDHLAVGFTKGDEWNQLVRDLSKVADENMLPNTVSQDVGPGGTRNATPFTVFMETLQSYFPDGYAKHTISRESLAKAIIKARKQ